MKSSRTLCILAAACTLAFTADRLAAQITIDGTVDAGYGSALSTQTINTGFGDSTVGNGTSGGGSELDAAYGIVQNNTLYLMFAGNYESNGNNIDIFIDDGRSGGENTLQDINGGSLGNMAGSVFSTGFNPTVAYDFNDSGGKLYLDTYNLIQQTHSYPGFISLTGGIGSTPNFQGSGIAVGFNDTNALGVNGNTGTAVTDPDVPNAVTTGIEIGIPLAALGSPSNTAVKVMAAINGGGNTYLSNQFLPGLPTGTGNLGGGGPYSGGNGIFNFSSLSNEYFTVAVPNLTGTWTDGNGTDLWGDSGNWSGGIIPQNAGDPANFTNGGGNVTIDNNYTVGSMSFNAPGSSYTLTAQPSSNVITLQNTSGDATITDYAGTQNIYSNFYLASNTDIAINDSGDSMAIIGTISGPGSLSSKNPGDGQLSYLYLYGPNTYTGGTIINSGTVQLDGPGTLPADTALTMNASDVPDPTLDLDGNNISISSFTLITGPQTVQTGSYAIIETTGGTSATITYDGTNANPSTFDGDIANYGGGTISLIINTGSFTFAGSSSMTGTTTVNSGTTLTLANPTGSSLPNSNITNNGTLNINDFEVVTSSSLTNNGTVNINAGGVYQLKAGSGSYTLPAGVNLTGGKIDTTDNSFVIPFTSGNDPIATIQADIKSAFDSGTWDGAGITSSLIATTPGTALGYADGNTDTGTPAAANTILVKLAWLGDLDLNGSVTYSDLQTLSANLGKSSNVDWAMGDLNYDGVINRDDLSLFMLGNALSGGVPLAVPEPSMLAAVSLPLLILRRRRRMA